MLVKLCAKSILSVGELKSLKMRNHQFLVVDLGGRIVCLDGRCTHAGAPLAEGTVEGEILTCPWHYSQFNIITGEVLHGPAYKPLKTYSVEIKDGLVFIDDKNLEK